jgi:hypothetical protein
LAKSIVEHGFLRVVMLPQRSDEWLFLTTSAQPRPYRARCGRHPARASPAPICPDQLLRALYGYRIRLQCYTWLGHCYWRAFFRVQGGFLDSSD